MVHSFIMESEKEGAGRREISINSTCVGGTVGDRTFLTAEKMHRRGKGERVPDANLLTNPSDRKVRREVLIGGGEGEERHPYLGLRGGVGYSFSPRRGRKPTSLAARKRGQRERRSFSSLRRSQRRSPRRPDASTFLLTTPRRGRRNTERY